MVGVAEKASLFRALHVPGSPLLLANPWDIGSAKILEAVGFEALATTSAGFANAIGKADGTTTRDEALTHAAAIAQATSLPVFADLEKCFADDPEGVADTVALAATSGIVGCSIEDATGNPDQPLYDLDLAVDRVAAAVSAAEAAEIEFTITARSENLLFGIGDVAMAIDRLQAYESVGAHVVYAPGLATATDVVAVVESVHAPVNVLAWPGLTVEMLAAAGAARVSTGSRLFRSAYASLIEDAHRLLAGGEFVFRNVPSEFADFNRTMTEIDGSTTE
ncbi:MAG: isocitrate lyase/phosphoenolpyruvate mutase family protein [Actinomycetia bacterium]|nr:isocitrate lyase/phosphoenolpyruvate mutase family protein [Actinomycetes bacterium]